ncbi:MAG: HEAT repeat domain-containing protein [Syntrophaceae bacterium]|nr:HEAT repeat domain-containing protein [Syntrophaceae bacterium]
MVQELSGERKALDLTEEMPLVEGIESDEELLLARDLTRTFVKTIKAFRFYPPDNPILKGFQDLLPRKFQYFLNRYHSFIFQIGEHTLSYKGKVLYENRDVKTSLAFLFYKDGLRELRFSKGLEDWEIKGLVDIIVKCDRINQLEDDFVTLMWERDFGHISYLATEEFLEDTPVFIPENIEQFRRDLVFKPLAHEVEIDFLEDETEEGVDLDQTLSKLIEELGSFVSNRSLYSLTPEEMARLRREVETEVEPAFILSIVDILFEILFWEKEPQAYQNAVNILGKVLDAMLTLGEFQRAAELLKRVYIFLRTYELKDWQTEILRKFLVDAGDERRIERVGRILEQEEEVRLDDVRNYLVLLQRNAVKPLIRLLGERTKSKARRLICDALSEIGRNSFELFVPYMDDPRWYLVRNITYILGRIGDEDSIPYIQKAFSHEDSRVRREAIQALGLIGGSKAIGLLVRALSDGDARIRSMAAINLGKVGRKAALGPLLEAVQSKDFQKREPGEIKAFFEGIGMVGNSRESILVLRQLLERKSLFGRGKVDEIRTGAAQALAMIGSPEAKAILMAGGNSKDESLREVCLQALSSLTLKEPKA